MQRDGATWLEACCDFTSDNAATSPPSSAPTATATTAAFLTAFGLHNGEALPCPSLWQFRCSSARTPHHLHSCHFGETVLPSVMQRNLSVACIDSSEALPSPFSWHPIEERGRTRVHETPVVHSDKTVVGLAVQSDLPVASVDNREPLQCPSLWHHSFPLRTSTESLHVFHPHKTSVCRAIQCNFAAG